MNKPRVIICERTGAWATAIARHLPESVRLRQTRALSECAAELSKAPASLVALELTSGNLLGVLSVLTHVGRRFPSARVMILAQRGLDEWEWLLREAGAIHFTCSPREIADLAGLVRGHVSRVPATRASFATHVWAALPWGDAAVG